MDTLLCCILRHNCRIRFRHFNYRMDSGNVCHWNSIADLVSPGYNEAIKRTKDLAAGAVLILAIAAAIVGLIIFVPKIIEAFG